MNLNIGTDQMDSFGHLGRSHLDKAMRQPKQVRWADERRWEVYENGGALESSQSIHPLKRDVRSRSMEGEALRTPRRRVQGDGARTSSATATLKMYLTDALGERRTHVDGQRAPATSVHETARIQEPHSPLSRFLSKREEQTVRRTGPHHAQRQFSSLLYDKIPRVPVDLLFDPASTVSSTTRVLKERIREAKTLRNERHCKDVDPEDASPSAFSLPDLKLSSLRMARRRTRSTHAEQSSEHEDAGESAASAPAPHPKPQLPILSSSVNSEKTVSPAEGGEQTLAATRLIQQAWSRYKARSFPRTMRHDSTERDMASISLPRPAIISSHTIPKTPELVHATSINVAISRQVEIETGSLAEKGDQGTLGSAAVMWIDDEWSFLEEGRSTVTFSLDDPVSPEEDVEVLAWKQPHVLVQIQETRRLRAVHAGRQQRKKQRENAALKTSADHSTAKGYKLRPLLVRRRRGGSRCKSTTIQNRPAISVAKRTLSVQKLPSTVRNDDNEVERPFVLFADPEQNAYIGSHNDLIELGQVFHTDPPSESFKATIFATEPTCIDSRQNETDIIPLTSITDTSDDIMDSECDVTSPSTTQHTTDDVLSNSERHSSEWEPNSSNYVTKPVIQEDSHVEALSPVLPSLMEVKIEVRRTLERIQSQYRDSSLESCSDAANSSISTPQSPETTAPSPSKQLEFLHVLEEFKQSLRPSSSIVSSGSSSERLWASFTSSLRAIDDADDEELHALVAEIQQRSSCIHWPQTPHLPTGGA